MLQKDEGGPLGPPLSFLGGGRGVSPPGARYFSHAGKVPKSALRGPAWAGLSPLWGGTALTRLPPKNPGDAALLR